MPGNRDKQIMRSNLVDSLINQLSNSKIEYCFWKSTFSLDKVYSGDADLDLLIDRSSLPLMESILLSLGFKLAENRWGMNPAGIYHFFGYDLDCDIFVHVHLFCQVQTGESFVKSHYLPLSKMLLENTVERDGIRLASKEAELVGFVLRYFIKLGSVPDLILLSKGRFNFIQELDWLLSEVDLEKSKSLLQQYCPIVGETLFLECIDALQSRGSFVRLGRLAGRIRRRLSVYKKYSLLGSCWAYLGWMVSMGQRRLSVNHQNKTFRSGGAVIVFLGPDAVGKTTLAAACKSWLQMIFPTRAVHAGRPPSSLITAPVHIPLWLVQKIRPQLLASGPAKNTVPGNPVKKKSIKGSILSIIYALRSVSLAWDRQRILVRARRLAAHGEIIICDRYPSNQVGAMDSPRLEVDPDQGGIFSALYNGLAHLEANLYRRVPPPDMVLRLKVSLETAKRRDQERFEKGTENDNLLESRHNLGYQWHSPWIDHIHDIDTERPLTETILQVKQLIWESL